MPPHFDGTNPTWASQLALRFRRWLVRRPLAIDLFCGAGGVSEGFRLAGVDVVLGVDIDEQSVQSYKANRGPASAIAADLMSLSPAALMRRAALRPRELDILTACAPCQTYSSLGAAGRLPTDSRNLLLDRVGDFVAELVPRAIVMENVPRIVDEARFARLVKRLRRLGYGVRYSIVDAASFGVPQRRRRMVLIGMRGWADDDVPTVVVNAPRVKRFLGHATVRDTLESFVPAADDPLAVPRLNYPPKVARRIAAIPKDGGSRSALPDSLVLECHRDIGASAAGSVYGRMKWDAVAPTLTTRCASPSCGRYLHPDEDRAITLREAALLQTFPAGYRFVGGNLAVQRQVGNAVPPRLAQVLGTVVVEELKKRRIGTLADEGPTRALLAARQNE